MKKIPILTTFLTVIILISCGEETPVEKKPEVANNTGVILREGTSVRLDPILHSAKIDQLSSGETVLVLDASAIKTTIGNTRDYWYFIENRKGVRGWVYGQNIKIIPAGESEKITNLVRIIHEDEIKSLKKHLAGKWWSVNRRGDFTEHGLDLLENGKYRSYTRGGHDTVQGEYNFDVLKNEIVFLQGTTFNCDLQYQRRGQSYSLYSDETPCVIEFKRIQDHIYLYSRPEARPEKQDDDHETE